MKYVKDTVLLGDGRILEIPKLSSQEEKSPLAKYFYMKMTEVSDENYAKVKKIDSNKALKFEEKDKLLEDGYLETEIGYAILEDGTGYVSSIVEMPYVTSEMIDWWFVWHPLEDLRYKIWNPIVHKAIKVSDKDYKKLTDSNIAYKERLWGSTHLVTEDIGMGMADISINFTSPVEFGFDAEKLKNSNVLTIISSMGLTKMAHIFRKNPKGLGIELRTRFWFSSHEGHSVPEELLRGLTFHALEEYTHLGELLPKVYEEFCVKV